MATAKRGDRVKLHFTGKLSDGTVFDSTENAGPVRYNDFNGAGVAFAPLELVIGSGEMHPEFEDALIGMEAGQSRTFSITSDRAFGPRHPELVVVVSRDEIAPRDQGVETFRVAEGRHRPNVFDPKVGSVLGLKNPEGKLLQASVVAMDDETVTLDTNHPLAGRDLHFEIRLVEIVPGSA